MNRRERRAATARGQTQSGESRGDHARESLSTATIKIIEANESDADAPPAKPSSVMRLFSSLLLSRWVLARVKNPEVERILISFALEAGRQDVADELIRRQAMRPR